MPISNFRPRTRHTYPATATPPPPQRTRPIVTSVPIIASSGLKRIQAITIYGQTKDGMAKNQTVDFGHQGLFIGEEDSLEISIKTNSEAPIIVDVNSLSEAETEGKTAVEVDGRIVGFIENLGEE